jgi:hypothetical protein
MAPLPIITVKFTLIIVGILHRIFVFTVNNANYGLKRSGTGNAIIFTCKNRYLYA